MRETYGTSVDDLEGLPCGSVLRCREVSRVDAIGDHEGLPPPALAADMAVDPVRQSHDRSRVPIGRMLESLE